jgi:hypothetical protein
MSRDVFAASERFEVEKKMQVVLCQRSQTAVIMVSRQAKQLFYNENDSMRISIIFSQTN